MQGYNKEIKKYRPTIRIQTMIDAERRQPSRSEITLKKKAVVRDWFKLVLWYVRLRRASKGQMCTPLFKIQQRVMGLNPDQSLKLAK